MNIDSADMVQSMMQSGINGQQGLGQRLIANKDSDGDGALSAEEFQIPEENFAKIDIDSNGLLTQEELKTNIAGKLARMDSGRSAPPTKQTDSDTSSDEDSSLVEIVGNGIDDDGDGEIDEIDSKSIMATNLVSYTKENNQSESSVFDLLA